MNNTSNGTKHFVYFYFNRNEPEKIRQVVPAHVQYWQTADLQEYQGGPFADRSGGLITFAAASLQEAEHMIRQDPFVREDLVSEKWIKEWMADLGEKQEQAHPGESPTSPPRDSPH